MLKSTTSWTEERKDPELKQVHHPGLNKEEEGGLKTTAS